MNCYVKALLAICLLVTAPVTLAQDDVSHLDARIKGQVLSTLYFDKLVPQTPEGIVEVKQGVVMINAKQLDESTQYKIKRALKNIQGVKYVQLHSS